MGNISKFKRYELKYLLSLEQYESIKNMLKPYTEKDKYYQSTVCSLYYDTADKRLVRRSIERPEYKEKLRLRSYGTVNEEKDVFIELKKKYDGVVYKRRICLDYKQAIKFLKGEKVDTKDAQIQKEIEYFMDFYKKLGPSMVLSYEREALVSKTDKKLRITFDRNLLYRINDLSLDAGIYGNRILQDDKILMEIKLDFGMPFWLVDILNKNKAYKTSFSKYGTAHLLELMKERNKNYG